MVEISRPMILKIGTPTLEKDLKKVHKLLVSAGYQMVDEGKYVHTSEPTLSAVVSLDQIKDTNGVVLKEVVEVILSDADSHVNQTIYNALATVFPLELTK
ncbi:MAG: hypothetical protein EAX90_10985 [Candidatus Heimdallarchaeota archaeon]|nr:hypothetical protein [Candidatus Heimdallarchaeota archaeon]